MAREVEQEVYGLKKGTIIFHPEEKTEETKEKKEHEVQERDRR